MNKNAQALGRLKKGVKEKPSEAKRQAARKNLEKAREAKRQRKDAESPQDGGDLQA